jgi:hypothetical protein
MRPITGITTKASVKRWPPFCVNDRPESDNHWPLRGKFRKAIHAHRLYQEVCVPGPKARTNLSSSEFVSDEIRPQLLDLLPDLLGCILDLFFSRTGRAEAFCAAIARTGEGDKLESL